MATTKESTEEVLDAVGDSTWLYELVRATVDALPAPKQRANPKAKTATRETNL